MSEDFENDDLTPLQRRFCIEYLIDLNGTKAAERAGSTAKQLAVAGNEFLRNPKVQAEIDRLVKERSERTFVTADDLLRQLDAERQADISDIYDDEGKLLPVKDWPLVFRQGLVTGIKMDTAYIKNPFSGEKEARQHVAEIKLVDRTRIKDLVGRHVRVQAFRDNVALSSPSGGPVEIDVKMSAKEAAETFKRMAEGE